MKKSRLLSLAVAGMIAATCFAGCGGGESSGGGEFDYITYNDMSTSNVHEDYNKNLYYANTLDFELADPSVIWVDKNQSKEYGGYFYAYGTSDLIGCHGIQCWRSTDLTNWEDMGVAFMPDYLTTWAYENYWAPEVIYDENDQTYYMYYNAWDIKSYDRWGENGGEGTAYISVAMSDSPVGPFICADESKPAFDFAAHSNGVFTKVIDASPFIDPKTGDKYLYVSAYGGSQGSQCIWGCKLNSWLDPDYSTLKKLTQNGYDKAYNGTKLADEEGCWVNEGPFMYYDEETDAYMMTLSIWPYTSAGYKVRTATASDPLGDFVKIPYNDGGYVLYTEDSWKSTQSAGHHCFIYAGDELFIAYHTFKNREEISGGRALAVDRVKFTKNSKGQKVMVTNGPTYSYQPLPEAVCGYKNVAEQATVTATNVKSDSSASYLNDGFIKIHGLYNDLVNVTEFNAGTSEITMKFNGYVNTRSILIYNAIEYDKTFVNINKVELTYKTSSGDKVATIKNLKYDYDFYTFSEEVTNPGGAVIAEWADLAVKQIKITFNSGDYEINIPEIVVMGNNKTPVNGDSFKKYSYTNPPAVSSNKTPTSATFGEAGDASFKFGTTWGVDLTNDYGMNDNESIVYHKGSSDQYTIFKGLYSNAFYAEGKITVANFASTDTKALTNDPYPKIGMALRNADGGMFFYIDASNGYTNKMVGYTFSVFGDPGNWDWAGTEETTELPPKYVPQYTNGSYTKMAILMKDDTVYLFCNDQHVATIVNPRGFNNGRKAAVGFLSFNTNLGIKEYYATTDASVINQKLALVPNA